MNFVDERYCQNCIFYACHAEETRYARCLVNMYILDFDVHGSIFMLLWISSTEIGLLLCIVEGWTRVVSVYG